MVEERGPAATCHFEGGYNTDYIYARETISNRSMRPIHDQIMATEHVRIAQLIFLVRSLQVPERCIKCVKTDCLVLQDFPRKRKAGLEDIAKITFGQLPKLRKICANQTDQSFLDCHCPMAEVAEEHRSSEVFRLGKGKPLQGFYENPWKEATSPEPLPPWKDLSKEEALQALLEGQGLLVLGPPGTGKTHWLRNAVASLRGAGKRVDVVAKTHAAVQNIGCHAKTADHYVRKYIRSGGLNCHALVVEELTQVNVQLWGDLALCRFKGIPVIACGDFGQFPHICEAWSGCVVPEGSLEPSQMLLKMCSSNRLVLTENFRSDAKLFGFYTNLGGSLEEAVERAKQMFPKTDRPAQYTLTMSHKRRAYINTKRNKEEALEFFGFGSTSPPFITIKGPHDWTRSGNKPQTMMIWPGLRLLGAGHKCLKGLFYEVKAVDDAFIELTCGQKLNHEDALYSLRLCYAITYASCQGLTLPGVVRLETSSTNFTMRHLYVGISRATSAQLVEVV